MKIGDEGQIYRKALDLPLQHVVCRHEESVRPLGISQPSHWTSRWLAFSGDDAHRHHARGRHDAPSRHFAGG